MTQTIYVLDNYYAKNHYEHCIVVKSEKTVEEMERGPIGKALTV